MPTKSCRHRKLRSDRHPLPRTSSKADLWKLLYTALDLGDWSSSRVLLRAFKNQTQNTGLSYILQPFRTSIDAHPAGQCASVPGSSGRDFFFKGVPSFCLGAACTERKPHGILYQILLCLTTHTFNSID